MFLNGQFLMRHRWRILIWSAACLAVFALLGFFAVPPILKTVLTKQLSAALHRDVSIRQVRVNPFALSATLRGFAVKEPKSLETFLSFEELYVNLESTSLLRWGIIVREIRLTKPFIRVVRHRDESFNFSDLLAGSASPPSTPTKPLRFSINNIRVIGGGADFQDESTQKTHIVRELEVGIPFFSNIPSYINTFVQPGLSVLINGTRYALEGKTKPFAESQETTLDLNITDLNLPDYVSYVPRELLTFALPSGRLDAQLVIVFARQGASGYTLALKGDMTLRNLGVTDRRNNVIVKIPTFSVGLASVEPLVSKVHLSKIALQSPVLTVRRDKTGIINLETLLPKPPPAQAVTDKTPAPPSAALALDVDEIRITGAKTVVSDLFSSLPFTTTLYPIDVTVLQLSNRPATKGSYRVTLRTETKEEIAAGGAVALAPLLVEGRLEAKAIPLKKYAPYYHDLIPFDIASGTVDASSTVRFAQNGGPPEVVASGAALSLSDLRLTTRDTLQEFLTVPRLTVANAALNLARREVSVESLSTASGAVLVSRSRAGEINLARMLPHTTAAVSSLAERPSAEPVSIAPAEPERPWLVKAGTISVGQYRIRVVDEVPGEPVSLIVEDLNLKAQNISTAEKQTGKLSLAFRLDKGTFSSEGSVGLTPLIADLQLALKELDVRPFQPYFTDRVRITVTDGRVSTDGRLTLSIKEPIGLQAGYTGNITFGRFASIDKTNAEDALKWDSLDFRDFSVGISPLRVRAKRVALTDFFARISIQPDGRLNLQEIFVAPKEPQPAEQSKPADRAGQLPKPEPSRPTAAGTPQDIQIEAVTLQGGDIRFSDRTLKPTFSAEMTQIGGRVSGLSSEETSAADLELRGKLNNSAPLEITGKINPLKQDLFVNARARFEGMDLSQTSPYSGKFVGYTIEKGKLSFDLRYLIAKRRLESDNKVFIDQFTFGEKVESPAATSLPVKLAVALLKDKNGEIHLDLPVTGSLDDPKFSVWGVILDILGNLITKAVTSPFAVLGAAFGEGEGLQYVEFDPGLASLPAEGAKKLDMLAKALAEKPSLRLEITGYVATEADREGLKQYLFQRKVKAQKLNDLVKGGAAAPSVDDVIVPPEEYEKYLTLAYRAEKFPRPRNFLGMLKSLPVPEMEKLILTHIEVGDDELRQLAARRADTAKETILRSGQVKAERLFILEPKTLAPEKKENQKDSRVEFKIG